MSKTRSIDAATTESQCRRLTGSAGRTSPDGVVRTFSCCAAVAAFLVSAAACGPTPDSAGDANDASPPTLRLGSAGLNKEFLLTESSSSVERRRAKRLAGGVFVNATAEDNESGIRSVTLSISIDKECGTSTSHQALAVVSPTQPESGIQPVRRDVSYTIDTATLRAGCAVSPESVTVSISAVANNGAGGQATTPAATVSSYGPDLLRVATFNMYSPHPDEVYERWGRELASRADIVILNEVPDLRRANLVAQQAGLPYVAMIEEWWRPSTGIAILSRGPFNARHEWVDWRPDRPGGSATNDSFVLSLIADLGRYPHMIVANNWGVREGDKFSTPNIASPGRIAAAESVLEIAGTLSDTLTLVAGDMNAFSGAGPQDHDGDASTPETIGSTPEMDLLLAHFVDPFIFLGASAPYCSNKRIDYVLVRGPYLPVKYEACFTQDDPSDHPFVLVTLEAGDR